MKSENGYLVVTCPVLSRSLSAYYEGAIVNDADLHDENQVVISEDEDEVGTAS